MQATRNVRSAVETATRRARIIWTSTRLLCAIIVCWRAAANSGSSILEAIVEEDPDTTEKAYRALGIVDELLNLFGKGK